MTFLNPGLLYGLFATLVPIVIYLIFFRRFRPVSWGAMEILRRAVRKQSQRLLLEDLIVLAVRVLVLALVALALCRPILAAAGRLFGQSSLLAAKRCRPTWRLAQLAPLKDLCVVGQLHRPPLLGRACRRRQHMHVRR